MDPFLLILVVGFLAMLLMNSWAKKKQTKQREERMQAIQLGNRVRTHSGFYGTVVDIDGEAATLESPGGAETVWHKNAIFGAEEPPLAVEDVYAPEAAEAGIAELAQDTDTPAAQSEGTTDERENGKA